MPYTLIGSLHHVGDEQTIKATLRKREFVVKTADNTEYPQLIKFELINDRCRLVEGFGVGQELEVTFSIKGREWTNPRGEKQFFVSLEAFKLGPAAAGASSGGSGGGAARAPRPAARPSASAPEPDPFATENDLPF